MNENKEIVKEIDGNLLFVCLPKEYYKKEAVFAAAHKFTDICTIKIEPAGTYHVGVYFKAKESSSANLNEVAENFCNEALEQQLRLDIEASNGRIKNLIVEQAFKPVEDLKKKIAGNRN